MTARSVTHGSFTLTRHYPVPPSRVFAAFADLEAKKRWFKGPAEWAAGPHVLDFRVGGEETESGGPPEGPTHYYRARYEDIVPDQRIVYTYDMHLDDKRISVSLAVLQMVAEGGGTRFTLTEHGAFLDGFDDPTLREEGMGGLLEALGASFD